MRKGRHAQMSGGAQLAFGTWCEECFDFQNISLLNRCSFFFFGGFLGVSSSAVCGLDPDGILDKPLKDPPTRCDKLAMLERLRRRSAATASDGPEEVEVDRSLKSRRDVFGCMVLIIVDRLLVNDGTSSTDILTSCEFSPVAKELMVRLSVMDDAEVPRRDVSKEPWRREKSGEEKVESV